MLQIHNNIGKILSYALWKREVELILPENEWEELFVEAEKQGVLSLVLQAYSVFKEQISTNVWRKWRNIIVSTVSNNYSLVEMQNEIIDAMNQAKIKCAILKGTSIAVCYTEPDMRALGDIDLLIPKESIEEACKIMNNLGFEAPDESFKHPYHIDFYKDATVVELHFAASTYPENECGREAKKTMETCWDAITHKKIRDFCFPCLSNTHQALSLLIHMERHMTTGCIGLRQLCDWAVFINNVTDVGLKEDFVSVLKQCGLERFACVLTKVSIDYLGLNPSCAKWCEEIEKPIIDAMVDEILRAGNISNKNKTDDISDFLVDRTGNRASLYVFISKINAIAKRRYKIAERNNLWLPFFWIFIPIRYWLRSLFGIRRRKSLKETINKTKIRKGLYRELGLYVEDLKRSK